MPNLSKLNFFEGVSKWEKGLRSCPIMLNAGRGDLKEAEPGVVITPALPSPVGGE